MYIVSPSQMKQAEELAAKKGTSFLQLMENAGAAAAAEILRRIPDIKGRKVLIICGKGNNGGDGYVTARLLEKKGAAVTIAAYDTPKTEISAEEYRRTAENKDIRICSFDETDFSVNYDIIIDALFGTGFNGEIPKDILTFLNRISRTDSLKIAMDLPSGINSLTGETASGTLACDLTVTFGAVKEGMLLSPAKLFCGETVAADIGISDDCFEKAGCRVTLMDREAAAKAVPLRGENCHKGTFGKLLIIAGSEEMSGAASMNTLGALRSGAGLVKLASVPAVIDRVGSAIFESTFLKLIPTEDGKISSENLPELFKAARSADCVSIGSGLSDCPDTRKVVKDMAGFCAGEKIPLVLDADGLNCIADCIYIIRNADCGAILTPHPAELGRLAGMTTAQVMADRLSAAIKLSEQTGAVVAAKGYPTYIVSPDGRIRASYTGNGGLSRGGSGDVLTGIISGLVCANGGKTDSLFDSACSGVYIFGLAADIAADNLSMTGMLPTDAAEYLPAAYKSLKR